jgi:hypothetical protein
LPLLQTLLDDYPAQWSRDELVRYLGAEHHEVADALAELGREG